MNHDDKKLSRAGMIETVALAPLAIGAFAALGAPAEAAATVTPQAAAYVTHPVGGKQCSGCSLFIPGKSAKAAGTCKVVKGSIAPNAYCKFFAAKPK